MQFTHCVYEKKKECLLGANPAPGTGKIIFSLISTATKHGASLFWKQAKKLNLAGNPNLGLLLPQTNSLPGLELNLFKVYILEQYYCLYLDCVYFRSCPHFSHVLSYKIDTPQANLETFSE